MKNKKQASIIFLSLASLVLVLGSCRKEKIKPEQANSFIKYYGKGGTQKAGNVALTPDGGYILVGTTDSYGDGKQILVVKTDQYGNEQWSKVLGGTGDDEGSCVIVSKNGNYILTGSKAEAGGTTTDVYVAELSADGTIVGENTFGTAGKNDSGARIINDSYKGANGYAVIGTTADYSAAKGIYLIKLNGSRTEEWNGKFGNNNAVATASNIGTSIKQQNDTVYVTTGNLINASSLDVLVTTGRFQPNTLDYNSNSSFGTSLFGGGDSVVVQAVDVILDTSKSKYILGNNVNGDCYITKVSAAEEVLFFKAIKTASKDDVVCFESTSDGGFIITGSTLNDGNWDILVIRTDANANPIWTKTFGGTGNDYGASVAKTSDGGFVVSGTMAFGGNGTGANDVLSLIRIDSNGELK